MLISIVNNQKVIVDPPAVGTGTVELRCSNIPLVSGDEYTLLIWVRTNRAQQINVVVTDSSLASDSLDVNRYVVADTWIPLKFDFTAVATDTDSKLRIDLNMDAVQEFYIDDVFLINRTFEEKEYRIMRIKGSFRPGGFKQTLTLREKTAAETA